MPVIIVYGIPRKTNQKKLRALCDDLRAATAAVKELALVADQVSCFFPSDMMSAGLGEEIIIYVDSLLRKPERTPDVRDALAAALVTTVRTFFSETALIECFVHPVNRAEIGFSTDSKE